MIIEFGHFALILAFVVALLQAMLPLIGAQTARPALMATANPIAITQFMLIAISFGALTYGFVTSDFSLRLVVLNSHSLKPMLYKISGVWGNHEGSMLLWVMILSLFGALVAMFGSGLPMALRARVLSVQGMLGVAFLAFILWTSNPFLRVALPPFDGQDLNPLLQDPGLAFHPPFLYLGYVGLSMAFSFAVAALIEGRVDAAWARWVRPWTLAAWLFLTIGIALGSWWAYYELGWGGFWFWDPVENASFMPWLIGAALLHSAIVVEKREALKSWTILLAIMAFGFSLVGTFIVRSGVLTSVHAFANDPERGVFILAILLVFTGGALLLYAYRAPALEAKGIFGLASRESALVLNNILLAVATFVVFLGTIWPLIAEMAFDRKLSVGPPFFDMAFTPFMIALALVLPLGSTISWKRAKLARPMRKLIPIAVLALAVTGLVWAMNTGKSLIGPIGLGLGTWLILGVILDLMQRMGQSWDFSRLLRLPRSDWGKALAHAGFGIVIIAIAGLKAWEIEDIRTVNLSEPWFVGAYELQLDEVRATRGPNYRALTGIVQLRRNEAPIATLFPEKRDYPVARMPTTEAAIENRLFDDVYVVLGDQQSNGAWVVRTYIKPLANWIWGGAIIMALGGLVSLTDRRLRVAAGGARITMKKTVVPAE